MTESHEAAIRILNDYQDRLERAEREGPLRFAEAFKNGPTDVGVHEIDNKMRVVRVSPRSSACSVTTRRRSWAGQSGK